MSGAEYMIRARGYIHSLDDLRLVPLGASATGAPVQLGDVANIQLGPELRRGVAELDGEGEVVGGVVVMRHQENAQATIARVKERLAALQHSLPQGVEIVTTYDRSALVERAVSNLKEKLLEESLVVALVCAAFLFHLRSALVAIVSLPVGILIAFLVMRTQGINANIMSLGGIAIAIGAMVDAAIVMIENLHKHIEHAPPDADRWQLTRTAAREVGPALFFSLLIITVSFLPVFTLEAQEGRMFAPLAYTKTYAMAGAALLAITLVPVLMGYLIRGRIRPEQANPLNRLMIAMYRPVIDWVLSRRALTLVIALLLLATTSYPLTRLGSEFMPPLNEGDLLYMPITLPSRLGGRSRAHSAADRPDDPSDAGSEKRLRQGRARRDRHRSRALVHDRNCRAAQRPVAVATRHDTRQDQGGAAPQCQPPRPVQHLDHADPHPHRHARHRLSHPGGHQGRGA